MNKWKPINFKGKWNYDPRGELRDRAKVAIDQGDDYVAIPVDLAIACADLHECKATTVLTADEDGPLSEPLTIYCRLPEDHALTRVTMHYNGYINWED